jgi:hypothetical protein
MSQLLAIQDNQHTIPECMPNANVAGDDTPKQNRFRVYGLWFMV